MRCSHRSPTRSTPRTSTASIHRDVKPANILLAADEHAYLGDFGLTRRAEDPDAGPAAGNSLGTVDYVAPEQIEGGPVDGRADVYSLGCVLYECLTGEPPYESSSPMGVLWEHLQAEPPTIRAHDANLPDAIDPVIARGPRQEPGGSPTHLPPTHRRGTAPHSESRANPADDSPSHS